MKPVIITMDANGRIVMPSDEFKRYIDAAYNQGYADGKSATSYNDLNHNCSNESCKCDTKSSIKDYFR